LIEPIIAPGFSRRRGGAVSAKAAQDQVVIENGAPGRLLQRGKLLVPDDAKAPAPARGKRVQ